MKHINNILSSDSFEKDSFKKNIHDEVQDDNKFLNPMSCELVNIVFSNFYLHCRNFDNLYEDNDRLIAEKTSWSSSFSRKNLTKMSQIRRGIEYLEDNLKFHNPPKLASWMV